MPLTSAGAACTRRCRGGPFLVGVARYWLAVVVAEGISNGLHMRW